MSRFWRRTSTACGVGAVGVAVLIYFAGPIAILQSLVLLFSEDTEYASGYSEAAFDALSVGDSETTVREKLGEPLSERAVTPYSMWLYAPDPHPDFATDGDYPDVRFSFTTIRFDEDGRFLDAFGQLSGGTTRSGLTTQTTSTFGPGQNTLKITPQDIETFKQERLTPEQVVAKFGPPSAKFVSSAVKWLQYSHSPGSTHYRQRLIGIDREGRVNRKVSEIYWD